jgi:hypothetical protein
MAARRVSELDPAERRRVERYMLLDEEQLFSLIPPYLHEYDGTSFSPDGQREAGRKWFEAVRGSLERRLCDEWQMCRKLGSPELNDATSLVIVIGDAIAATVTGVPPVLVGTIIARIGVRRFCGCP